MPSAEVDASVDPALVERFHGDLERLIGPAGRLRIGVALSNGPDSCALLLLAAAAAPERTFAMTVDHGLRTEARDEATAAGALCATLGVPHAIARVTVVPDGNGLQAGARDARYTALADWAGRERLDIVLTAHHADDQAETLLMRLARGSGLAGLAGIRTKRSLRAHPRHAGEATAMLLRPLLSWRKAELETICAAAGIVPARDPSNHDPRYDRTVARDLLAQANWLDPIRINAAAAHLAEAEAALETIAAERAATALGEDGEDATLRPTAIAEIDRRLLRRLLRDRFAKHPDGPAVERTLSALRSGQTTTCADIVCRPKDGLWRFRPAPPRQRPKRTI
jgi:tRNA(Ile)-lysidine synthase